MRIIAGEARGIVLETIDGDDTRPTLGRVKENFFNSIHLAVQDARILDLFAGSGQLGLEALSRGAREAVFIEPNAECIEVIKRNAKKTKLHDRCRINRRDYSSYLSGLKKQNNNENGKSDKSEKNDKIEKFDIVFIDPPYDSDMRMIKDSVSRLVKNQLVSNGGLIICETGNGEKPDFDEDITHHITNSKIYKYGKIYITVLATVSIESEGINNDEDEY